MRWAIVQRALPLLAALCASPLHAQPASPDPEVLLAAGRAANSAGDRYTALRLFGQARLLRPDDLHIARAIADVLVELNAPDGAAAALGGKPDIGLRSRQAAARVRWGEQVPPIDETQRFAGTDGAIAELQALLHEAARTHPDDTGLRIRLRRDLVVAFHDRERWSDAVSTADALRADGDTLPPYVRKAEADALLALRRPEDARRAYQDVIDAVPNSRTARTGRFYAEFDSGDVAAARATLDELAAGQKPWRHVGGDSQPSPNDAWLDTRLLASQADRFADMPAAAWRTIEPLAAHAPAAPYVRLEAGEVAAARGWVRRAHEDILIAHSLAPNDVSIQLTLAESLLRRRHWNDAAAIAQHLQRIDAGGDRLQRLLDDLATQRRAELHFEIRPRAADGGGPDGSGDGLDAAMRFYSPPLGERWRLLAAAERQTGNPTGTVLTRDRYGVGVEARWPDVTLELLGWQNTGELDHFSADARVRWTPDDHWGVEVGLRPFSASTPLRALEAGIHANELGLSTTYAWNESAVASAGITTLDFSDGNHRLQATADLAFAVVDRPRLDVVLRPSLYASRNTRTDAPYFNPRRDAALTVGASVNHALWQRYERRLVQSLQLNAGGYWQDGFGTAGIGDVTYRQTYEPSARTAWHYGLGWSHRVYDGDAERALTLFVGVDTRF
ncbi:poly-beta-1,6 N-acetyl-D-glucosamine export porin PgaA [Lysobacter sp. HA18]